MVALGVLLFGGVLWRYLEALQPLSLDPYKLLDPFELGLFHLSLAVLLAFSAICLTKGFTKWSAVLLVVPYVLVISSQTWMLKYLVGDGAAIDEAMFKRLMWLAAFQLGVIYVWILSFPLPVSLGSLAPEKRALWKRLEVAFPVFLCTAFLVETAQLTFLADAIYRPEMAQLGRFTIQNYVLGALLCLLFKVGLRLWVMESAHSGRSVTEPTG